MLLDTKIITFVYLVFYFLNASAFEFEMAYSGGGDCKVAIDSFNESINKTGGIDKNIFDNVNDHQKRILMGENLELNRMPDRIHDRVFYYKLNVDSDDEGEIILETNVLIDSSYRTNRQYYLIDDEEASKYQEESSLKTYLERIKWVSKEGLDIPKMLVFPMEFNVSGVVVRIEESRPFLVEVNSRYYILLKNVDYFTLVKLESGESEGHCLFKTNYSLNK